MSAPSRDPKGRMTKSMLAAIFTLSISGIFLGCSIISYTVMKSMDGLKFEQMQRYNLFSAQQSWVRGDFLTCIIEANKVFSGLSYIQAQSVRKDCRKGLAQEQLSFARQLRNQGRQEDALRIVASLAKDDAEAKKMMEEIASQLLEIGKRLYQERSLDNYNHAKYPLLAIPPASSYYNPAQTLLKQWDEEHTRNKEHIQAARLALDQENASQVQQALEQVSPHPFWQDQAKPIRQEGEFLVIYQTAEALMERNEWENAIVEASKLPNVPPWIERRSNLISRAEATLQRKELCKTFTLGLVQKCYM